MGTTKPHACWSNKLWIAVPPCWGRSGHRCATHCIPVSKTDGRWDKASDIASRLNDEGYDVTVRTIQRDLMELSEIFPIELNDKNPRDYGWRWRKGANLDIPGMSISEALAMQLVEKHLHQMLPASMLEGLQGVFSLADDKLTRLKKDGGNKSR